MALTQEDIDAWAAANPNASNAQIAAAINSVGGLDALAGLNLASVFSTPSSSASSFNWDGGSGLTNTINLGNGQYITPTYSDTGALTKIESSGWNNGANSIWGESGNYDPRVPSSAGGLFGSIENILGKATEAASPLNNLVANTVGKLTPEQTALLIMGGAALSGADAGIVPGGETVGGSTVIPAGSSYVAPVVADAATVAGGTGALTSGLTAAQLASLAKAGITAAGLLGGTKAAASLTGGGTGNIAPPAQNRAGVFSGSANYSPEYYAAIQDKYNQMMSQQKPRDVTTELKNWYETKYAPSVTVTPKVA